MVMKNEKKLILVLLLFFLCIRIGVVIIAGKKDFTGSDALNYDGYATAIVTGSEWIINHDFNGSFRPPFYPIFIAVVYALFGVGNYLAVYIFQAILSTFACYYIYKFSKEIFNEIVALLTLLWTGIYFFYIYYAAFLLRETLVFFLIIAVFYYLYLFFSDELGRKKNIWIASILFFLLIHTDARYLFYLPFFIFLFIIYQSFKRGTKNYFFFLTVTILLLVPWTIRNYLAYNGFVLINTRTLDLRHENERNSTFSYQLKSNVLGFRKMTETWNDDYPTEEERRLIKQGLNPNGRQKAELNAIKKDVYPASTFLKRKLSWLVELWRPVRFSADYYPFPDARFQNWSLRHNLASGLSYGILIPFMLFGIYFLIRQRNKIVIFLVFPLAVQSLLHVLQWGHTRYRIPIDAFVIIIAFSGIYQIYCMIRKKALKSH